MKNIKKIKSKHLRYKNISFWIENGMICTLEKGMEKPNLHQRWSDLPNDVQSKLDKSLITNETQLG